jgi:hypothetical protein
MSGITQKIAKKVGDKPPYPLYEIPFTFRGEERFIHYTLYRNHDDSVGSGSWLKCNEVRPDGAEVYDPCICCPDMNAVEELAMRALIVADVSKPGNSIG